MAHPPLRRYCEVIRGEGGSLSTTWRERRQPPSGLTIDGAADTLWRMAGRREVSLSFHGELENQINVRDGGSAMLCDVPS